MQNPSLRKSRRLWLARGLAAAALEFGRRNGASAAGSLARNELWQFRIAPSYRMRDDFGAQLGCNLKVHTLPSAPNQPLDNALFLSLKFTY
jgi:hypothetical protein